MNFNNWLKLQEQGIMGNATNTGVTSPSMLQNFSPYQQNQSVNFQNFQQELDKYLNNYKTNTQQLGGRIQAMGKNVTVTNKNNQSQQFVPDQNGVAAAATFLMQGQPAQTAQPGQ